MTQAIYHVYLGKPTEAWYQLSREEQGKLFAQAEEALAQVGGKGLVLCDSRWASEQWPFWGVEQYPNLEAVQKHAALLEAIHWFRYVEAMTLLGTEFQPS